MSLGKLIHFFLIFRVKNPYFTISALMQFIVSLTDDHSRVVLEKIEGDPSSDYINASYIPVRFIPLVYSRSTSWRFIVKDH